MISTIRAEMVAVDSEADHEDGRARELTDLEESIAKKNQRIASLLCQIGAIKSSKNTAHTNEQLEKRIKEVKLRVQHFQRLRVQEEDRMRPLIDDLQRQVEMQELFGDDGYA